MATMPTPPMPTPPETVSQSEQDRRDSERHMTIFRAGKLTHGGRENLCLVRNISSGGAMAQVYQPLVVGDEVVLDLRLEDHIVGRVVWVRGEQAGLEFAQRINLAEVLKVEVDRGHRRRAPRVSVEATGRLQVGEDYCPVAIDNVSQTGTRIFCPKQLPNGSEVRLWIDGLGGLTSFVQWTRDGIVGLAFLKSLSIGELTTWVRSQTETAKAVAQQDG